jgi:hypothetical protein
MTSSLIARLSALILTFAGLPLLFAGDIILPRVIAGYPADGSWLAQLVAAAWLSIALFNWNGRHTVMGGIYGRPAVNLNLVLYVVSALGLLKAARGAGILLVLAVPFAAMAIIYGALLWRGPFVQSAAS